MDLIEALANHLAEVRRIRADLSLTTLKHEMEDLLRSDPAAARQPLALRRQPQTDREYFSVTEPDDLTSTDKDERLAAVAALMDTDPILAQRLLGVVVSAWPHLNNQVRTAIIDLALTPEVRAMATASAAGHPGQTCITAVSRVKRGCRH